MQVKIFVQYGITSNPDASFSSRLIKMLSKMPKVLKCIPSSKVKKVERSHSHSRKQTSEYLHLNHSLLLISYLTITELGNLSKFQVLNDKKDIVV